MTKRRDSSASKKLATEKSIRFKVLVVIIISGSYLDAVCNWLLNSTPTTIRDNCRPQNTTNFLAVATSLPTYLKLKLIRVIRGSLISQLTHDFKIRYNSWTGDPFRVFKELIDQNMVKEEAVKRILLLRTNQEERAHETDMEKRIRDFRNSWWCRRAFPDVDRQLAFFRSLSPVLISSHWSKVTADAIEHTWILIWQPTLQRYQCGYRNILYRRTRSDWDFINYEPDMQYLSEWWNNYSAESDQRPKNLSSQLPELLDRFASIGQSYPRWTKKYLWDSR